MRVPVDKVTNIWFELRHHGHVNKYHRNNCGCIITRGHQFSGIQWKSVSGIRDILTNDSINSRLLVITFQWTSIWFRASTRQQNPWKLVFIISEYWWHHITRDFYCIGPVWRKKNILFIYKYIKISKELFYIRPIYDI